MEIILLPSHRVLQKYKRIYIKHLAQYVTGVQQMLTVTVTDKCIIIILVIVKQNKPPRNFSKLGNLPLQDSKKGSLLSLCVGKQLLCLTDCKSHETGTTCQMFLGLMCHILEVYPHTPLSLLGPADQRTAYLYQCTALWTPGLSEFSVHGEVRLPSNTTMWKNHMQGIRLVICGSNPRNCL